MTRSEPGQNDRRPSARLLALALLQDVLRRQRPLEEALSRQKDLARLSVRDRGFARHLVATTLRRLGQIDLALSACLDRPVPARQADLHDVLRLGAAQLLFLGTPPHAAVSTTVDLAAQRRLERARGLVNAVMRRLDREGPALLKAQDAGRLNTPDWLWDSWCRAYGEPQARAIAEAHLAEPPLDLTVKSDAKTWARRLEAELLPNDSLRLPPGSGEITRLAGYEAGAWWVQDAAAAWPARLFGDLSGRQVIDLCAAPGGKTAQLAAGGAKVTAVDRSPQRMARLTENLARLGLSAECVTADAGSWHPSGLADAVLLDAPCSATGTLRRHPDIAHIKEPNALVSLQRLQDTLLAAAVDMLKPGGQLVYATCSLQPEEGPERIAVLLTGGAPVKRIPVTAEEIGGLEEAITPDGDLRSLPCHWGERGGLDGFYACRLERLPS